MKGLNQGLNHFVYQCLFMNVFRSSKELLLTPVVISRNKQERVLIEGSINSLRISIGVKQVSDMPYFYATILRGEAFRLTLVHLSRRMRDLLLHTVNNRLHKQNA